MRDVVRAYIEKYRLLTENRPVLVGCIFPGIEVRHQERDIQFSGILPYKLFVTQGFVSPQMKITMRRNTGIARLHQNGE